MNEIQYMRAFSENEIQHGSELYFSDEIKKISTTKRKKVNSISDISHVISGTFFYRNMRNTKVEGKCEIAINDTYGMVVSTKCECNEYKIDDYGCQHVAALLTAFMDAEQGESFFRGSKIETMLKNIAMVEDPFQPGVLKKTDDRLLSIMMGDDRRNLPIWKEDVISKDLLSLKCLFDFISGEALLQIKVGKGKKTILVKEVSEFLDSYIEKKGFLVGKTEYLIAPECFEASARNVLDYLSGLYLANGKNKTSNKLFLSQLKSTAKYIRLDDRNFDNIIEYLNNETVEFSYCGEKKIGFDKKGLYGLLEKKAYGSQLTIKNMEYIYATSDWIYFYDNDYVYRVLLDRPEIFTKVKSLININEPLYIRESDMPRFIREIAFLFEKNGELELKGIEFENYEKEKPAFIFKFDYSKKMV